ncbi:hypothetical protein ES319_A04G030000v1 [Gossypium barbadense]|uniref:Uncharacterized protein n=3 Tax=Gossypium TaxID=3633 RepID=A0A5J5W3L9_GOSBA|nr:hypothetical protein ES319_A04G030000v1 [Gossypium barbadense]TYH21339.1 hypothetical protein ES288_A04G036300v1 [Gossypium darwinii]
MVVLIKFCNMYSCIWYSKLLVTYVNSSHVFLSFLVLLAGLANLSVTDCGSNDPDLKKEMEKQFVDFLTEELKLQEAVAEEHIHYMNITFGEAKRVASQYLREAEKCIAAIETCEGARERAEALLIKERKVTTIWEQRARQMGWEGE